jgi:transcriptional regulator with XRE-family HTH domain
MPTKPIKTAKLQKSAKLPRADKKIPILPRNSRKSSVDGDEPNPVDVYVGLKLKARRNLLGVTQEDLAEAAGITFQQVQKYEKGKNRLSASRLFQFARVLDVPVAFFFDGFFSNDTSIGIQGGFADNNQDVYEPELTPQADLMLQKETIDLVRTYYTISDEKLRKDFLKMLKQLAKNFQSE